MLFRSQTELWKAAAEIYNKNKNVVKIQYGVVMLRVQAWGIPTKTQPSRKIATKEQTPPPPPPEPEPEPTPEGPRRPSASCPPGVVLVAVPSGDPPFPLRDFSPESVAEWCDKTSAEMLKRGSKLLPSALCYYLRSFVDINDKTRKYNQISEMIHAHYGSTFAEPM